MIFLCGLSKVKIIQAVSNEDLHFSLMKIYSLWFYIIGSVVFAVIGNSVSSIWAKNSNRFSPWLIGILIISPLVFISFGLVTEKIGLAISSSVIDSLLTVSTIIVGLLVFQEWSRISLLQYLGMMLALMGILLMLFFRKEQ